jgi:hypothetical protein
MVVEMVLSMVDSMDMLTASALVLRWDDARAAE